MKLELKLENKWLEATWYAEDNSQAHCEYFSGHPEHIAMLRAKASEYGTELDEAIVQELANGFEAPTEAELLANAKQAKQSQIRDEFEVASNLPVEVNGVSYVGGFESAIKLDAAKRMAEQAGVIEVVFFDINNDPNVLSLTDATAVVLSVGADYQTKFATKQARMVAVSNATTIEEVEVV